MAKRAASQATAGPGFEQEIRALYRELLSAWNRRDAVGFASLFAEDSLVIGFDGSQMTGSEEIRTTLVNIFASHSTASYVFIVRRLRLLDLGIAALEAAAGMVPPGDDDINPAVNAIQTLVASKKRGQWRIELFQNTPAAYHGRPEAIAALTAELRAALRNNPR